MEQTLAAFNEAFGYEPNVSAWVQQYGEVEVNAVLRQAIRKNADNPDIYVSRTLELRAKDGQTIKTRKPNAKEHPQLFVTHPESGEPNYERMTPTGHYLIDRFWAGNSTDCTLTFVDKSTMVVTARQVRHLLAKSEALGLDRDEWHLLMMIVCQATGFADIENAAWRRLGRSTADG